MIDDAAYRMVMADLEHRKIRFIDGMADAGVPISDGDMGFMLDGVEFDVHVPGTDVLVNFDSTLLHNSHSDPMTGLAFDDARRRSMRRIHARASGIANSHGYRCIHVWDWDDPSKLVPMLGMGKEVLHARECAIADIDAKTANLFLEMNHLQGRCKGQRAGYGLYHHGMLIGMMNFGKPRYNRKFEWELLRLCFHPGYRVVGGSERMFKRFLRSHDPESIISYCDKSKFRGDVYLRLGMELKNPGIPARHWYSYNADEKLQHITNNLLLSHGYDQIFGEHYGKGTSNEELILARGYLPIWDCGQMLFEWHSGG